MTMEIVAGADIHHHFPDPDTGAVDYDEDGDPLLGWYYVLLTVNGEPVTQKFGPYNTAAECEAAAKLACETGDY